MSAWRLLSDDGAGAAEGLALDEALMASYARHATARPPTLRLYTYRRHVALVGRYQHLEAEVDLEACAQTSTEVSRRPTGGGAIIMGPDQLGVALVTRAPVAERPKELLARLSGGIVEALGEFGIEASFRGKNDLEVGGRKIAGLGLYLDGNGGLLFHASVLGALDVELMLRVLRIPVAKLADKAAAVVSERVTTVSEQTGDGWDGAKLRPLVAAGFASRLGVSIEAGEASRGELELADRLAMERYGERSWIDQRRPQPDATGTATLRTPAGTIRLYLALQGDTIKSALFTGDFSQVPPALVELEGGLKWKRLERSALERAVGAAFRDSEDLGTPGRWVSALLEAGGAALERPVAAPVRHGSCYFPERTEAQ